jgi:hypothetical protein
MARLLYHPECPNDTLVEVVMESRSTIIIQPHVQCCPLNQQARSLVLWSGFERVRHAKQCCVHNTCVSIQSRPAAVSELTTRPSMLWQLTVNTNQAVICWIQGWTDQEVLSSGRVSARDTNTQQALMQTSAPGHRPGQLHDTQGVS